MLGRRRSFRVFGSVLLGRGSELDRIDALLDQARSGSGGALLLRGEPGIGKTSLLQAARERADGMNVARAGGVEAEAQLPFAALGDIATPVLGQLATLPEPQADAISAALALAPSERAVNERLAMFAGFLGLISAGARERPLLILVDDAQWLDRASADCLGYAARRLGGSSVALLIAARPEGEAESLSGGPVEEIVLGGLERVDALALLSRSGLAEPVAELLLEASLGNPLALIELPSILSDDQRRGVAPIDSPPVPGGSLREVFERRVSAAGPQAAALLLVAAASFDRSLEPVVGASRDLGIADEALDRCEAAGLVETGVDGFRLAHPLLRGVVYGAAPAAERRRAHRALADHTSPDSRAWHLATAAIGPEAEVAGELDRAAERAAARGAHAGAADALERAAELSLTPTERDRRLFAAGFAAVLGGAYERGAALLESAAETEDSPTRVRVRHMLGMVTLNGGIRNGLENHRMLTEDAEAVAADDPAMAALLHADAGVTATVVGLCDMVLESAERAVACLPEDAPVTTRCQVHSIHGMGLALKGRTREASVALDRAGELLPQVDPVSAAAQSISFALMGRLCTGGESMLLAETRRLASVARESRSLGILPWFQLQSADAAYRLGDWAEAEREAEEAVANAEVSRQLGPLSIALIVRARVHAARGRERPAREDAQRGVEIGEPVAFGSPRVWSLACLGFLELSLGHVAEAIEELEQAEVLADLSGLVDPLIVPWAPDLVEAYVRSGRDDEAARLVEALSAQAERGGAPLAHAFAGRCRGIVADEAFEQEFERALEWHDAAGLPFERGRTLLAFGVRLHRARRRVEARERLREALETFDRLGAPNWAERARVELRAAGGIERKTVYGSDELTAQEVRVAMAVARGAKNREVAAELFLSPKTIDFHLGRVYRKLGIHSRTELATIVAEGGLEERPA